MAVVYDTASNRRMVAAMLNGSVRDAAEDVLNRAKALAAEHRLTGEYINSIEIQPAGALDYEVVASDPAAVPIEFGHTTKDGKRVEGQKIMTRAAGR